MPLQRLRRVLSFLVLVFAILALAGATEAQTPQAASGASQRTYLPLILDRNRPVTRFGVEIGNTAFKDQTIAARARDLGASWVRISVLSWRQVQPTPQSPYNWDAMRSLEDALLDSRRAGLIPTVVVTDFPLWATEDSQRTCGPIRADRFDEFAAFMGAAAARYRQAPYNVHYWELGNEPDVDPLRVTSDSIYGCWGDEDTPNYGGEHYGNMLKVVTPAIKAADPSAKVIIGGLLLANPSTPDDAEVGHPENFFRGILQAGAAPDFDIVAYHAHSPAALNYDSDLYFNTWESRGGRAVGKAQFLRQIMNEFGVSKPLILNEASHRCPLEYARCATPGDEFFQPQADFLVRLFTRAAAQGVEQITWYVLEGPGWQNSGLLSPEQNPRPAYRAYQELLQQVTFSITPPAPVGYGTGLEAYRFSFTSRVVDVVWSLDNSPDAITFPGDRLIAAYSRDGARLMPEYVGGDVRFNVGPSPIYIHRLP